ncbi:MAG: efflux RND transporter periplasmic adaptor subunit [bacterium]
MKIIQSIFITLLILLVSTCAKKESVQEKVFPVNVLTLTPKTINSTISVSGTVDSKVHTWVSSPVEGTVSSLNIVEGDNVNSGKILCYIMPVDQQNLLGQAHADFEQARMNYEKSIEQNKDDLAQKLKEAETRLESAKKLYKPIPVVSPIKGTVISKNIEVGTNVSVKQPLIEIANLNQLIIKSAVSEEHISKIKLGQTIKVKVHSLKDTFLIGKISVITPGVRTESRTADIEISTPQDKRLRPGMTASLELVVEQKQNAMVIPQDILIVKPNGDKYVFIAEGDTAKMVKITTGIESNTEVEVTSGLKEGDKVVILGQENLKDGVKIKLPEAKKEEKR